MKDIIQEDEARPLKNASDKDGLKLRCENEKLYAPKGVGALYVAGLKTRPTFEKREIPVHSS